MRHLFSTSPTNIQLYRCATLPPTSYIYGLPTPLNSKTTFVLHHFTLGTFTDYFHHQLPIRHISYTNTFPTFARTSTTEFRFCLLATLFPTSHSYFLLPRPRSILPTRYSTSSYRLLPSTSTTDTKLYRIPTPRPIFYFHGLRPSQLPILPTSYATSYLLRQISTYTTDAASVLASWETGFRPRKVSRA
jgi:hypothetical protein